MILIHHIQHSVKKHKTFEDAIRQKHTLNIISQVKYTCIENMQHENLNQMKHGRTILISEIENWE